MMQMHGRTLLLKYLRETEIRQSDLARTAGIGRDQINHLVSGRRVTASLTVALKLEKATDGAVPATSWLGE